MEQFDKTMGKNFQQIAIEDEFPVPILLRNKPLTTIILQVDSEDTCVNKIIPVTQIGH